MYPQMCCILHYVWHDHCPLQPNRRFSRQIHATVETQHLVRTHQQSLDPSVLEWSGDHSAAHLVWKTLALSICSNLSSETWLMLLLEFLSLTWKKLLCYSATGPSWKSVYYCVWAVAAVCVTMCFNASLSISLDTFYLFANGQANELSISGSILSITVQWDWIAHSDWWGQGQEMFVIGWQMGWLTARGQWIAWWNCYWSAL